MTCIGGSPVLPLEEVSQEVEKMSVFQVFLIVACVVHVIMALFVIAFLMKVYPKQPKLPVREIII